MDRAWAAKEDAKNAPGCDKSASLLNAEAANALSKELGIIPVRTFNGNVLMAEHLIVWQQDQSSGRKPFTFDQMANKWKKIST